MRYERDSEAGAEEFHCYFPEWADRPAAAGVLLEADHNSYLAGGYSEEFGYDLRPDRPPVFPPLDGDPEDDRLWCVQIGGLHPGYPECPYPHDRDRTLSGGDGNAAGEGASLPLRRAPRSAERAPRHAGGPDVVAVGASGRGSARGVPLSRRLTAVRTRLQALGASLHSAVGGVAVRIESEATAVGPPSAARGSRTPARDEASS